MLPYVYHSFSILGYALLSCSCYSFSSFLCSPCCSVVPCFILKNTRFAWYKRKCCTHALNDLTLLWWIYRNPLTCFLISSEETCFSSIDVESICFITCLAAFGRRKFCNWLCNRCAFVLLYDCVAYMSIIEHYP